jgi:hypothetical protein
MMVAVTLFSFAESPGKPGKTFVALARRRQGAAHPDGVDAGCSVAGVAELPSALDEVQDLTGQAVARKDGLQTCVKNGT